MDGDVRESFLRLTEARSAEEVQGICEADPRLLDPEFEAFLMGFEDQLRAQGEDIDQFAAWRLVLRSVREGRNLYASVTELIEAASTRAVLDVVVAEPLLLEPVIDTMLVPLIRAARQQGADDLAEAMESRRRLLARFRAHGPLDGYFDLLVTQFARADAARTARLRRENADLAEDFGRYAQEQLRAAATLGHHDRLQQLMLAVELMIGGNTVVESEPTDDALGERIGRLAGLVLGAGDPGELRDSLLAEPELLSESSPVLVGGLLRSEIERAALDRDVVRVRQLWVHMKLLSRCAEIGVEGAFAELETGELWPRADERI